MRKYLVLFLMLLLIAGLGVSAQAQWVVKVEENPFSEEKKVAVLRISEDGEHLIAIRNLFEPIDLVIVKNDDEIEFSEFSEARYKFDDQENKLGMWYGSGSLYSYMGDTGGTEEGKYDDIRDFVRNMMEYNTLTVEVKYAYSKNEYPVFNLSGLTETITPYLDDFGL